jgi:hypothetical protein
MRTAGPGPPQRLRSPACRSLPSSGNLTKWPVDCHPFWRFRGLLRLHRNGTRSSHSRPRRQCTAPTGHRKAPADVVHAAPSHPQPAGATRRDARGARNHTACNHALAIGDDGDKMIALDLAIRAGLLAIDGGAAVGWCQLTPPDRAMTSAGASVLAQERENRPVEGVGLLPGDRVPGFRDQDPLIRL